LKYKKKCVELSSTIARLTYDNFIEVKRTKYEQETHRQTKVLLNHCRGQNEAILDKIKQLQRVSELSEDRYRTQILNQADKLTELEEEIADYKAVIARYKKKQLTNDEFSKILATRRYLSYNRIKDKIIIPTMSKIKVWVNTFLTWFDTLPDTIQILTYGAIGTGLTLLAEDIKNGIVEWNKYWVIVTVYLSNVVLYAAKKFLVKKTA
jgi:hypothetical protein